MSRWHLTSSKMLHSKANETCDAAELVRAGRVDDDGGYLSTYMKRAIQHSNFLKFEDDQWIAVAGTLIYGGRMGTHALEHFYESIQSRGIEATRAASIGHWAVAIRQGASIRVFTDDQGTHNLYYATTQDHFFVSTSLHVIANSLGAPTVHLIELVSFILQEGTVGEDTFYRGVRRLFGNQILDIDVRSRTLTVHDTQRCMITLGAHRGRSIQGAVALYAGEVRSIFEQIAAQPSLAVNTTGGLDTRTILAALSAVGAKPQLLYGVGNSHLTNTRKEDLQVVEEISSRLSLPLYKMNWAGNQPDATKKLEKLFRKYGYLITTLGASESLLEELEGRIAPYPALQLGGYCPAFTPMKLWEKPNQTYTFSDILNHLTSCARHLSPKWRRQYVSHVEAAARVALRKGPVTGLYGALTLTEFVQARLFLFIRAEAYNLNFFNEFCYYLAPFFVKKLCDPLLTVPPEFRRGDEFQLRLIAMLAPEMLEFPMFSGLQEQVVDRSTYRMSSKTGSSRLRRLKAIIPAFVKRALRLGIKFCMRLNRAHLTDAQQRNIRIKSDAVRHIRESGLVDGVFREFEFNLSFVYRLRQVIAGVRVVERTSRQRK